MVRRGWGMLGRQWHAFSHMAAAVAAQEAVPGMQALPPLAHTTCVTSFPSLKSGGSLQRTERSACCREKAII